MTTESALAEAQSTCDGLHNLIRQISVAAVDIDKGGSSSYEMLALIASANTCVINLATQLSVLENSKSESSNVLPIKRQHDTGHDQSDDKISAAK